MPSKTVSSDLASQLVGWKKSFASVQEVEVRDPFALTRSDA